MLGKSTVRPYEQLKMFLVIEPNLCLWVSWFTYVSGVGHKRHRRTKNFNLPSPETTTTFFFFSPSRCAECLRGDDIHTAGWAASSSFQGIVKVADTGSTVNGTSQKIQVYYLGELDSHRGK